MEGLYFDQSGILVVKEMVEHANLVPNLVSLCLKISWNSFGSESLKLQKFPIKVSSHCG
jgi:hypothetical protein